MHWIARNKATASFSLALLTVIVVAVLAIVLRGDGGAVTLGILGVCAVAGLTVLGLVYRRRG